MNREQIRALLDAVRAGTQDVEDAVGALARLPYEDLGYARLDRHRALRQGVPEVVYGEGKTPEQIAGIAARLLEEGADVLVTRVGAETAAEVRELVPALEYRATARVLLRRQTPPRRRVADGDILVVTAGTSDLPVAEEAICTLELLDLPPRRIQDVGVAGLHRLLAELPALGRARAVVVVAGMEGALPSVVGGLLACPVVAVPTSVGYGAGLGGFAALAGMLTSCASGVTVVNVDNGFGAAFAVARMVAAWERS